MARRLALAMAVLFVLLATVVAVTSAQRDSSGTGACWQYDGHARERCEAAQADHRAARLRAHCRDNPEDTVCQRAHAEARREAYCRDHPDEARCTQ